MTENITQEDEANLLDYWRVLVKHKKLICIIVIVAFVVSIIYSLSLPKIYASTASIIPPRQESSLDSSIASKLGGLGSLGGFTSNFLNSSDALWVSLLTSQTLMNAMINRFDLIKIFDASSLEDARNTLGGMVNIENSEGIIFITVEDKDPEMTAMLANGFAEELDKLNRNMALNSVKRTRLFIEERLEETRLELKRAEEAVKEFKEKNKVIALEGQSSTIISAIGSVNGQLMAKEVELNTLLSYATPNNPNVEILKTQIEGLKVKLKELEEGKKEYINSQPQDSFIPTIKIPDLSLQYVRLLRNAKVQENLYELLTQQ